MWIKADYKMVSPAIINTHIPLDGVFSYSYAQLTEFKYQGKEGYIYDNLPINRYGYIDELPIRKTKYDGNKWFYNISGMLFLKIDNIEEVSKVKSAIVRKYIEDTDLWKWRYPNIENQKWNYSEKSSRGKEKAFLIPVEAIYYPQFSILLEIDEEKESEVAAILENIKTIGKKVNQGYGFVEFIGYEAVGVENYTFADTLIRPVPKSLIEDKDYFEIEMKLFTPYYIKNNRYTDKCFVDEKLLFAKTIEFDNEKDPEVVL